MFESLGERLQNAIDKVKGYGKITESNIDEVTREIRLALLEADVNYKVVKEFIASVKEKALGEDVAKSLKPSEVFVKILKDELVELLGGEKEPLNINGNPAILMMVGLQGSGKTTTIGKLANFLRKKQNKNTTQRLQKPLGGKIRLTQTVINFGLCLGLMVQSNCPVTNYLVFFSKNLK